MAKCQAVNKNILSSEAIGLSMPLPSGRHGIHEFRNNSLRHNATH
eukprot:CAMPEP_0115374276 /NCGR_PEP_ID=MMETSP0271-20121206/1872_1 /TAXON_ID=71861 /ORGANISM="Scrippsiella trochoidea, Strain CCMP3099" /LENGTH=44 /DNA_ID= /DNA_START= /DNA_END= /DNA_ORIENTATION=